MYYPAVAEDFTDFHRFFYAKSYIFRHKYFVLICVNLWIKVPGS